MLAVYVAFSHVEAISKTMLFRWISYHRPKYCQREVECVSHTALSAHSRGIEVPFSDNLRTFDRDGRTNDGEKNNERDRHEHHNALCDTLVLSFIPTMPDDAVCNDRLTADYEQETLCVVSHRSSEVGHG